jgi:pyrrolidone-carboxylate peptidase
VFKNIGLILSILAFLIGGYEAVALVTPAPTISRMMQGLRDAGHPGIVWLISGVFVCIFALFGAWLYYHLNYQPRSGN